jgi:uncharacterized protein YndB with AHSA1/START domain
MPDAWLSFCRQADFDLPVQRSIKIQRLLPHPVSRVWQSLTDSRILGAWLMENDFAPVIGHTFTFRMKPQRGWDGITYCEVLELDPLSRVAYSYRGRASGEKTLSCAGIESERAKAAVKGVFADLDTVLRFILVPEIACDGTEKTRLTLEHEGFKGLKLVLVSFVMGSGWKKILDHRLPATLAHLAKNA